MKAAYFPAIIATLLLGAAPTPAPAQIPWATEEFSRQNRLDVYGIGQYLHQANSAHYSDSSLGTVKLSLRDTGLGGAGIAWHFSDYFALRGDFLVGGATFKVHEPGSAPYRLGHDGWIQSGRINLDYNIINRRLSPFITAGIGYQYFQVDQGFEDDDSGPSYRDDEEIYEESDFTWNAGAGVRWNVTDNFFIKASAGAQWVKYEDSDNIVTQIEAFLAIGVTFP